MDFRKDRCFCFVFVIAFLTTLLFFTSEVAAEFEIELKPQTARSKLGSKYKIDESRLHRGVAGDAVESALERLKSLGKRSDPVAKGNPIIPGQIKAGESGTPGLDGHGNLEEKNSPAPQVPNTPGPPPQPQAQSQAPQICQQILGLIQQVLEKAGGQSSQSSGGQSSGCSSGG